MEEDGIPALVAKPAEIARASFPALLRGVELAEVVAHAALDPEGPGDDALVDVRCAPSSNVAAHSRPSSGRLVAQ